MRGCRKPRRALSGADNGPKLFLPQKSVCVGFQITNEKMNIIIHIFSSNFCIIPHSPIVFNQLLKI